MRGPLHQTYELYLDDGKGAPQFLPLTCPPDTDLFAAVGDILRERRVRSIEVRRAGDYLFTLKSDRL